MRPIQIIALSLLSAIILAYCSNPSGSESVKKQVSSKPGTMTISSISNSSKDSTEEANKVLKQINAVTNSGKAVFLVVYNRPDSEKEKAIAIAREASDKVLEATEIFELNTAEPGNRVVAAKYRLDGATLPLIMVIDKNGIPVGGLTLTDASPYALISIIPSPKYSEIFKALSEQKSIFLIAYKETMAGKAKAFEKCKKAIKRMKDDAVIVQLNIDSKIEADLLFNLSVNKMSTEPIIYTINKTGQITGTFAPEINPAQMALSAKRILTSECAGVCATGCTIQY